MAIGIQDLPNPIPLTFAIIIIGITIISAIFSAIIPTIYFIFGRCQSHPTKLIAYMCLIDLLLGYNLMLISLNIYNIENSIRIKEIYALLTFHFKYEPSDVGFCSLNLYIFVILETLSLSFNICLAIDLIITLSKPFVSGKSRQIFYYMSTIIFTIGIFFSMTDSIQSQCYQQRDDQDFIIAQFLFPLPLMVMMVLFEVAALFTVIWALIQLYSKSNLKTNLEKKIQAKSAYIKQHVLILIVLMLSYIFPILNNFLDLFNADQILTQYIRNFSFLSLLISGAFVNIVRMTDPYVKSNLGLIWSKVKHFNFQVTKQDESECLDAWNTSLNDVVVKFQNESIIQNIVFIVEEISKIKDSEDIISSNLKMKKTQLDALLNGHDKSKLQKATKLQKVIETRCVQYGQHDPHQFRNNVINNSLSANKQQNNDQNNYNFKIKATALAYYVFEQIRLLDGLTNQMLNHSLNLQRNSDSIKQTKQSLGASGSFFFFTFDKRLIIKTITSQEQQCLLSFLPQYYIHLIENPKTLLAKIYGIYNVQIGNTAKITFLLMQNSFYNFDTKGMKYKIFDMKGSLVKRQVQDQQSQVLKDVNFLKQNHSFIYMTKFQKHQFLKQIKADTMMLAEKNLMDYSLLLGVSNDSQQLQFSQSTCFRPNKSWKWIDSTVHIDERIYSISIIDYLQKFNCQKYTQLKYKTFLSPNLDVSCINTKAYYERYIKFLESIIVVVNQ